jgi:tRNA pseudouridine55 synthase
MFGILNLNKPSGPTSRACVSVIEKLVRPLKAGHAGTLDPIANGVLLVLVGQAVRLTDAIHTLPKEYVGRFQLGVTSESADTESELIPLVGAAALTSECIERILPKYTGHIEQTPPKFSAIWIDGKRAHELAREGKSFEIPSRKVHIEEIELTDFDGNSFELRIRCGTGTYVRSLGRDIALELGSDAVMTHLTRTAIGPFSIQQSCSMESMSDLAAVEKELAPPRLGVQHWQQATPSEEVLLKLEQGKSVMQEELEASPPWTEDYAAVVDTEGRLRALVKKISPQLWRADKCFLLSMQ